MTMVYSSAIGYTTWFFRISHPIITVNGKPSEGWLHRGRDGNVMFLTERSSGRALTYNLVFADNSTGHVFRCGAWVAPRWPVIARGDLSPPCLLQGPPRQDATRGPNSVSFSTFDGRKVEANW